PGREPRYDLFLGRHVGEQPLCPLRATTEEARAGSRRPEHLQKVAPFHPIRHRFAPSGAHALPPAGRPIARVSSPDPSIMADEAVESCVALLVTVDAPPHAQRLIDVLDHRHLLDGTVTLLALQP